MITIENKKVVTIFVILNYVRRFSKVGVNILEMLLFIVVEFIILRNDMKVLI